MLGYSIVQHKISWNHTRTSSNLSLLACKYPWHNCSILCSCLLTPLECACPANRKWRCSLLPASRVYHWWSLTCWFYLGNPVKPMYHPLPTMLWFFNSQNTAMVWSNKMIWPKIFMIDLGFQHFWLIKFGSFAQSAHQNTKITSDLPLDLNTATETSQQSDIRYRPNISLLAYNVWILCCFHSDKKHVWFKNNNSGW